MVQVVTANHRICFHIKSCVIVPYNKTMNTHRLLCADIPPRNNSLALYPKSIFDIHAQFSWFQVSNHANSILSSARGASSLNNWSVA